MGEHVSREFFRDAVHEVCGISLPEEFDDISLLVAEVDSLDVIEISMILEERLGVTMESQDFEGVQTFGDTYATIERYSRRL